MYIIPEVALLGMSICRKFSTRLHGWWKLLIQWNLLLRGVDKKVKIIATYYRKNILELPYRHSTSRVFSFTRTNKWTPRWLTEHVDAVSGLIYVRYGYIHVLYSVVIMWIVRYISHVRTNNLRTVRSTIKLIAPVKWWENFRCIWCAICSCSYLKDKSVMKEPYA